MLPVKFINEKTYHASTYFPKNIRFIRRINENFCSTQHSRISPQSGYVQ